MNSIFRFNYKLTTTGDIYTIEIPAKDKKHARLMAFSLIETLHHHESDVIIIG